MAANRLVWQRDASRRDLAAIVLNRASSRPGTYVETPEVTVQGLIPQAGRNQWIIHAVPGQWGQPSEDSQDSAWLFQPELIVTRRTDAPIFERRAPLAGTSSTTWTSSSCHALPQQVEFAVGHGVAVDAAVARDLQDARSRSGTRL